MSIQKVSLESIQKIRQYLQKNLTLPTTENRPKIGFLSNTLEEIPEPESLADLSGLFNVGSLIEDTTYIPNAQGRWFISTTDPGVVFAKLPGLKLRHGIRLISYLYRLGEDGVGVVWAVPEAASATAILETALPIAGNHQKPPYPPQALEGVMEAVEGDRSPLSFVIASLLLRELQEFGSLGKHCHWSHHRLISTIPNQVRWQWRGEAPKDLSPKVRVYEDGKAIVEFFTCRVVSPIAVFRHLDRYSPDSYQPTCVEGAIAIPQRST
jgi:hypothetical protein